MTEKTAVEFVEEWQAGFFLVVGSAVVGVGAGLALGSVVGPPGFLPGFVVGGLLAFLAYSAVRYGR